jgi:hypothetical protein
MQLLFKREGGFIGITKTFKSDVSVLPPDQQAIVHRLFEQGIKLRASPLTKARDLFKYTLQIMDSTEHKKFEFDDLTVPDEARPLVQYLSGKAETNR